MMLIGYILEGKALDNNWQPITRINEEDVIEEINIFGENGRIILKNDEKIILEHQGDSIDVLDDWAGRGGSIQYAFKGYLGKGTTIVTNKRILHYRTLDPVMAAMDHFGPGGIPNMIGDVIKTKKARQNNMFEFCEIPFNEIVTIVSFHSGGIHYCTLTDWKRYNSRIYAPKEKYIEKQIFNIVVQSLKSKKKQNFDEKNCITIIYHELGGHHVKDFWKRDDLIKKARKYEKKQKFDKAIVQYRNILDIFPNDEDTKRRIAEISEK